MTRPGIAEQQSVTKIIKVIIVNLVTPKAGAMRRLLFNKPASEMEVDLARIPKKILLSNFL
jgi:hypothetical protein